MLISSISYFILNNFLGVLDLISYLINLLNIILILIKKVKDNILVILDSLLENNSKLSI